MVSPNILYFSLVGRYAGEVKLSAWQWSMSLVTSALFAVNLWALCRRGLWRRLPFLLVYLLIVCLRDLIYLYGLYFWPMRYASWFYWIGEGVIYVLSFLLVMSIWKEALGRLRGLWLVARWFLPGILLAFLMFHWWSAQSSTGSSSLPSTWARDWLYFVSQNLSLTQALFLAGFLVVVALFRVSVAPLVQRIAACWFAYSLAKVVLLATRHVVGQGFLSVYNYSVVIAFLALLSTWAIILWRAQPADLQAPQPVYILQGGSRLLAGQLEAVNRSLSRLLKV